MTRFLFVLALVASGATLSPEAQAQIATDRPGLGFNPSVVDRGTFQVEVGLPQATRLDASVGPVNGSLTVYSFPVQLRYGITETIEARLGTPSVYDIARISVEGEGDSDGNAGLDVVELGAKVQLATNGPVVSVIPSVFIPTTEASDLGGAFRAVAGWTLSDRFGLTTVLGAVVTDSEPDTQVVGEAIAVVGTSLSGALSAYAEIGAFPSDAATPVLAGGGLALLLSPDVQLDASFDVGLNDDAPDVLFGAGASVRF